jgi:hypothetical protein
VTERALPPHQRTLRPAATADCRRVAEPYRMSSDGMADDIWTRLAAAAEDLPDIGPARYVSVGNRRAAWRIAGRLAGR